ncbi:hypothetical protein [Tatumella morbirosei]|nr:hypothetical protein [Tatumella morbirosei]
MNITYDDLLEKQRVLDRKYTERLADLIEGAEKILEEYRESLVYHGDNRAKIAFIGEPGNGKAEFVRLSEAQLDAEQRLKFGIMTDLSVNDLKKRFAYVELTLSMHEGKIFVSVGDSVGVPYIIPADNSAYSYHQVCLAIKKNISDRLDAEMPR